MKPWKVILATLVIFVAGLVTGGLLVKGTQPRQPRTVPPEFFLQGPHFVTRAFLQRMNDQLDLSPAQLANLEKIMDESRERVAIWWDILGPEMQAEYRETRDKIRAELTPQQQDAFERLIRTSRPGRFGGGPPWEEQRRTRSAGSQAPPAGQRREDTPAKTGSGPRRPQPDRSSNAPPPTNKP